MRNRLAVLVAVAAAVLVGCDDAGPAATPRTTTTTVAGTLAEAPAPAPVDAQPKRGTASPDAALTVAGIRIGRQPGFDRIVFDLGGKGTPGWTVEYTERAVQDGSGRELDIPGRSVLEVRITGSAYPFDSGVSPYAGPDPATDPDVPGIAVATPLVFEGVTQSFIGVDGDRPAFSVSALSGPTRLVIDIASS
ncbi:AMIN-like domain-containing (lipo)protein [Nocardia farcinica]|uniref:AMIN-like domain-containing (lipo)protein n=1 Tax=Nocardia farcinica TaxID=37329 RepID=UPI0018942052|nr:hypothetical protein [Nocardia farcinica]MBF6521352.1 hypothetical protein [Nocardia farcinica]